MSATVVFSSGTGQGLPRRNSLLDKLTGRFMRVRFPIERNTIKKNRNKRTSAAKLNSISGGGRRSPTASAGYQNQDEEEEPAGRVLTLRALPELPVEAEDDDDGYEDDVELDVHGLASSAMTIGQGIADREDEHVPGACVDIVQRELPPTPIDEEEEEEDQEQEAYRRDEVQQEGAVQQLRRRDMRLSLVHNEPDDFVVGLEEPIILLSPRIPARSSSKKARRTVDVAVRGVLRGLGRGVMATIVEEEDEDEAVVVVVAMGGEEPSHIINGVRPSQEDGGEEDRSRKQKSSKYPSPPTSPTSTTSPKYPFPVSAPLTLRDALMRKILSAQNRRRQQQQSQAQSKGKSGRNNASTQAAAMALIDRPLNPVQTREILQAMDEVAKMKTDMPITQPMAFCGACQLPKFRACDDDDDDDDEEEDDGSESESEAESVSTDSGIDMNNTSTTTTTTTTTTGPTKKKKKKKKKKQTTYLAEIARRCPSLGRDGVRMLEDFAPDVGNKTDCCDKYVCRMCLSLAILRGIQKDWGVDIVPRAADNDWECYWVGCPASNCGVPMPLDKDNIRHVLQSLEIPDVETHAARFLAAGKLREALCSMSPPPSEREIRKGVSLHKKLVRLGCAWPLLDGPDDAQELRDATVKRVVVDFPRKDNSATTRRIHVALFTHLLRLPRVSQECSICAETYHDLAPDSVPIPPASPSTADDGTDTPSTPASPTTPTTPATPNSNSNDISDDEGDNNEQTNDDNNSSKDDKNKTKKKSKKGSKPPWVAATSKFLGDWAWQIYDFPPSHILPGCAPSHSQQQQKICRACWATYIDTQLELHGHQVAERGIPCPIPGCGRLEASGGDDSCSIRDDITDPVDSSRRLTFQEVQKLARPETFARYDRFVTLSAICKDPGFRWCLRAGCENGAVYYHHQMVASAAASAVAASTSATAAAASAAAVGTGLGLDKPLPETGKPLPDIPGPDNGGSDADVNNNNNNNNNNNAAEGSSRNTTKLFSPLPPIPPPPRTSSAGNSSSQQLTLIDDDDDDSNGHPTDEEEQQQQQRTIHHVQRCKVKDAAATSSSSNNNNNNKKNNNNADALLQALMTNNILDSRKNRITCDACRFAMCFTCQTPWHPGLTCTQARTHRTHGDPQPHRTRSWLDQNTKKCPGKGCGIPVQKGDGCFHMTCSSCSTQFCWECLADWKGIVVDGRFRRDGHREGCYFRQENAVPPTQIMGRTVERGLRRSRGIFR